MNILLKFFASFLMKDRLGRLVWGALLILTSIWIVLFGALLMVNMGDIIIVVLAVALVILNFISGWKESRRQREMDKLLDEYFKELRNRE